MNTLMDVLESEKLVCKKAGICNLAIRTDCRGLHQLYMLIGFMSFFLGKK